MNTTNWFSASASAQRSRALGENRASTALLAGSWPRWHSGDRGRRASGGGGRHDHGGHAGGVCVDGCRSEATNDGDRRMQAATSSASGGRS